MYWKLFHRCKYTYSLVDAITRKADVWIEVVPELDAVIAKDVEVETLAESTHINFTHGPINKNLLLDLGS